MNNPRLAKGKQLLTQARMLLNQVQEAIKTKRFGNDDLRFQAYNDLIRAAAETFPEDPILNGQMVIMPDKILQAFSPEYGYFPFQSMPLELPSTRTEDHLTRLIYRLELLVGEDPTQQPLDERDFAFITDPKLQEVLRLDFIEAQKSYAAGAYKACGLLCGGLIEGMFTDICKRPSLVTEQQLNQIANELKLPRSGQSINWARVSMTNLIELSGKLGLVSVPTLKFTEGARDVRDNIHPNAEVRQNHRVSRDESEILINLVKLIYNAINAKLGT